jgi:MFS family permease
MTDAAVTVEKPWYRWLILLIISMLMFGSYYIYDVLSPINDYIQTDMHLDNARFGWLFSLYSLPNLLFLVVVAGFLLDRIGVRKAGTLYAFLILLGSLLTSLGAGRSFILMLVGRAVFGFGSEAAILVTNKVIARWFKGRELGFAFGLNITVMRLGTILALNSSAQIADRFGSWRYSVWAGTAVMLVSFVLFLIYLMIDRNVDAAIEGGTEEKIAFRDITKLGPAFWIISFLCVTFYSAVFPFTSHATRFLQMKFNMSAAMGGRYTSYIMTASMIFTPILGLFVDKFGHRGKLMIVGSLLIVPAHLLLGLTYVHPAVGFILLGCAFSLVPSALWPAVPILVREKFLGTAYGIIGWVQNIGLTVFPALAGIIVDKQGDNVVQGYTNMEWMFASLSIAGLVFAIMLLVVDRRYGTGLELPTKLAQSRADDARAAG